MQKKLLPLLIFCLTSLIFVTSLAQFAQVDLDFSEARITTDIHPANDWDGDKSRTRSQHFTIIKIIKLTSFYPLAHLRFDFSPKSGEVASVNHLPFFQEDDYPYILFRPPIRA